MKNKIHSVVAIQNQTKLHMLSLGLWQHRHGLCASIDLEGSHTLFEGVRPYWLGESFQN